MNNIKYIIIFLTALLIIFVIMINLKEPHLEIQEPIKAVNPPIVETITLQIDPAVVVPNNPRLGLNITRKEDEMDLNVLLKKFNPSSLRDAQLLTTDASIPKFLELCVRVGANPWIAIPFDLKHEDLEALALYLGQYSSKFSNVIFEIGNDPKNSMFSLEPIPTFADSISSQDQGFSEDTKVDGTRLAKNVIELLPSKPYPLMISSQIDNQSLGLSTNSAIIMLNQVIGGSLHNVIPIPLNNELLSSQTSNLTLAAFRSADQWSAAITSKNPNSINLVIQFPDDGISVPSTVNILEFLDTNATIVNQSAQVNQRNVSITLPPYGFAILLNPSKG